MRWTHMPGGISTSKESFIADLIKPNGRLQLGERGWVPSTFQHICQFVAGLKSGGHPQSWADYCSKSSSGLTKWCLDFCGRDWGILGCQVGARQQVQGQLEDLVGDQVENRGLEGGDRVDPSVSRCLDVAWSKMPGGGEGSAWTRTIFVKDLGSRTVRTPVGCFVFYFHANVLMVWWLVVTSWMEQQLLAERMASKMKVKGRSDGNQSCKGCLRSSLWNDLLNS